jgi:3-hydroxyisobutyrate dehydrogenase-like beta-hydroxyacid dehydrogenase
VRDVAEVVGIVSPGAMGGALGARLREGGARVVVALEGRGDRTRHLADEAGLEDLGSLAALAAAASVILVVVPPEAVVGAASALVGAVGEARPVVVELDAVSPETTRRVADLLATAGLDAVDGSISGPPPRRAGTTRIYLSGPRATEVAALPFAGVERVVVGDAVGAASAVKMCTASVYKGRVALLAQALRTARAHGVVEHVVADLAAARIIEEDRLGSTLAVASTKAWRYVAEMEEIALSQADAGLTPELFHALAGIYAELAERPFAAAPEAVPERVRLADVLDRLSAADATRADAGGSRPVA